MFDLDLSERLPTQEEIRSAAEAATAIARSRDRDGVLTILGAEEIRLAPALAELMVDLLTHVARGDMVTLVPTGAMLTTQEAADLLNVSRPFLSKLLKKGKIPYIMVGSHRRVSFKELMAYKEKRDAARSEGLDELARSGQEFDGR